MFRSNINSSSGIEQESPLSREAADRSYERQDRQRRSNEVKRRWRGAAVASIYFCIKIVFMACIRWWFVFRLALSLCIVRIVFFLRHLIWNWDNIQEDFIITLVRSPFFELRPLLISESFTEYQCRRLEQTYCCSSRPRRNTGGIQKPPECKVWWSVQIVFHTHKKKQKNRILKARKDEKRKSRQKKTFYYWSKFILFLGSLFIKTLRQITFSLMKQLYFSKVRRYIKISLRYSILAYIRISIAAYSSLL